MASFLGQPRKAGTRKVEPFWILMKQEIMGWQWHQLDCMQIICTTDIHASTLSLNFYRLDALPHTQPTVSKHRRNSDLYSIFTNYYKSFTYLFTYLVTTCVILCFVILPFMFSSGILHLSLQICPLIG